MLGWLYEKLLKERGGKKGGKEELEEGRGEGRRGGGRGKGLLKSVSSYDKGQNLLSYQYSLLWKLKTIKFKIYQIHWNLVVSLVYLTEGAGSNKNADLKQIGLIDLLTGIFS